MSGVKQQVIKILQHINGVLVAEDGQGYELFRELELKN